MKPKILLIEDDKNQVNLYKTKFMLDGFDFVSAYDGPGGLAIAAQKRPDLIFLDIILPGMNGIEVLRQLKNNPKTKDVPVVLLTNLTKKKLFEEGKKLGAVSCVVKTDITLKELAQMATEIIKTKNCN